MFVYRMSFSSHTCFCYLCNNYQIEEPNFLGGGCSLILYRYIKRGEKYEY
jgi:hypothetical protein